MLHAINGLRRIETLNDIADVGSEQKVAIAKGDPPALRRKVGRKETRQRKFSRSVQIGRTVVKAQLTKSRLPQWNRIDGAVRVAQERMPAHLPSNILPTVISHKYFEWFPVTHVMPRFHAINTAEFLAR